jgi:hypothetical protein
MTFTPGDVYIVIRNGNAERCTYCRPHDTRTFHWFLSASGEPLTVHKSCVKQKVDEPKQD